MKLEDFKKEYVKLTKKYGLPSFEKVNVDFEIDKFDKETDHLLRAVRKIMMEKVVNSITFLEMLLNPVNSPRMYLPFIRTMNAEDRKIIDNLYSTLADLSLLSLDLEIDFSEKGEADLIKRTFDAWNSLKPGFAKILSNIKQPKNLNNSKKERSYYG